MLFQVTHIDAQGHRRKARVSARNTQDAADQMDQEFGESRVASYVRMAAHPVLCLVVRSNASQRESFRGLPRGS